MPAVQLAVVIWVDLVG